MTDNRRENFRAAIAESISAVMFVGYRQTPVRLVEESSGGLSAVTKETLAFPLETEAVLKTDDGRTLQVRIKHYERRGMNIHVGMQRVEAERNYDIDLRRDFLVPAQASGAKLYAGVLLLGLLIGCAAQTDTVQRQLLQISFVKTILSAIR